MTLARGSIRPPPPVPDFDRDVVRKGKLAFLILTFAVHATLGFAEMPQAMAAAHAAQHTATNISEGDVQTPAPRTPRSATRAEVLTGCAPAPGEATQASRGPKFPRSPSRTASAGPVPRVSMTPAEREKIALAYDKFNSSFQLILQFSQYYEKKQRNEDLFVPTEDGLVVRAKALKNPWGKVVVKHTQRSWNVRDVREGDMFYFAIPFDDLSARSVAIVRDRLRRHMHMVRQLMATNPQHSKGRRWLLYDLTNHVLPCIQRMLDELAEMVKAHGDANIRFPVFLFRERELHAGERALHPGNLVEVMEQVRFYFQQSSSSVLSSATGGKHNPKLERMSHAVEELRQQRFTGDEQLSPVGSDDDNLGYGHGAISSESEHEL